MLSRPSAPSVRFHGPSSSRATPASSRATPPSSRAVPSSGRAKSLAVAVDALWASAAQAQAEGDHARAEGIFATLVKVLPNDGEAWFAKAIAAGWAAEPGRHRFDEVMVGVGFAIECAPSAAKRELRRRGARALALLAEITFDELPACLAPGARVTSGRACLRLLDHARELDPAHGGATRAILHVAESLLGVARVARMSPETIAALDRHRRSASRALAANPPIH